VDLDIREMIEKMKYRIYYYNWMALVAMMLIFMSSCSKKIIPGNNIQDIKTEKANQKDEKIENFNYLFFEALKQKCLGNLKNALKYFLECEKIKPDDAVEYQISEIFTISGQEKLAVEYGEKALKKDPGNIWYYYQLANEFKMFGEWDSLINIYERIVERFPDMIKDKIVLGDLYMQTGKAKKAKEIYIEVEKKYGKSKELEKKIIQAYLNSNEFEKAINEIRKAHVLFGEDRDFLIMKAEILDNIGKDNEAGIMYETVLEKYVDDPKVIIAMFKRYMKVKKYEEALNMLEKIISSNQISQDKKLDYMFEVINLNDQNINISNERVEKLVQQVYEGGKGNLKTQLLLADYYAKRKEYNKAMDMMKRMIEKYPLLKIGWQQLLYIAELTKDPDTIIYYAKNGIEIFKDDPLFYVYMCTGYYLKNNNEEIIHYANDGITIIKKKGVNDIEKETGISYKILLIQFYSYLGEAYRNLKQYEKSDQAFERGLKVDPENLMLLNNYSYYLSLRKEKLRKAKRMSKRTIKKEPENSTYLDTYGWVLFKMGRIKKAEKYILKAIDNGGDSSPDILEHYGDILYKKGKKDEAIKYWKMAIEKMGNKNVLEKKIESLKSE